MINTLPGQTQRQNHTPEVENWDEYNQEKLWDSIFDWQKSYQSNKLITHNQHEKHSFSTNF